jgi:DNA-binding SARP family transcriptional activator
MLSVALLGDFFVSYNDVPVKDIDKPRMQSLLAYLLLHRDAPQSRAHLAFLFWPDTSEAQARTNLRNLLHHLRHALPEADSYLDASGQSLQWRPDSPYILDVADFEAALSRAEQAGQKNDLAAVRQGLEQAVALYKGDLLPSCYDDWIIPAREGLRQAYLSTLERLVRMLEEGRDYPSAISYAQHLLRYDPLHEATYRHLMRLHALNDDRAGALRVYHTCTTVLQRELEVEPSAATRRAYQQLLGEKAQPSPMPQTPTAFSPLVGRGREWTQLLQGWRSVSLDGEPKVILLSGEAGIGKTRLVEEMLQWAARQGITSASARCYAAEGDLAYAPVTAWLRAHPLAPMEDVWLAEISRLLPEIITQRPDLPKPLALTEAWQRQHLFEALSRAILSISQPILLAIDDLQWCDRDTLEWLHFLLRYERKDRLLVLGAYRPEEIGGSHPLRSLLQALRLEGLVTEIELAALDEAYTATLASQVAGMEVSIENARHLYRQTEGNPLFVVESVRAGLPVQDRMPDSEPTDDLAPGEMGLPAKVLAVLESRLAQVSPSSQALTELAATIGREFSFKLLERACGCDQDTLVRKLDELWQRRIVREHGAESYDFSHDKLREVTYLKMSCARRRLLHKQVAQALETLHGAELDPLSHQLASHYDRAGLPRQAIPYYLRAAELARQIYANDEAMTLLRRGIALFEEGQTDENEHSARLAVSLWEGLGDILEMKIEHEQALQAYQVALGRVPQKDRIGQARLRRKIGAVRLEQRLYSQGLEACQRAEVALGKPPDSDDDDWWDEWLEVQVGRVWAHYWLAQWAEMDRLVDQLQPVVEQRGSGVNRMRFLMASCLLHLRKERYVVSDEMLANSREALAASQKWGSLKTRIDCQFEYGFLHLWRGDLDEAQEYLQAALGLAESSGFYPQQTLCLTYLTVLHRFRSQLDVVLDYARRAQASALAALMPDYVAAAKGDQAWLSWREGDLPAAGQLGQEALTLWRQSPLVYPFQWLALWPLISVELKQGRETQAWLHVRALLDPTQQLLPHALNNALQAALQAQEQGQLDTARLRLEDALSTAREMGYL